MMCKHKMWFECVGKISQRFIELRNRLCVWYNSRQILRDHMYTQQNLICHTKSYSGGGREREKWNQLTLNSRRKTFDCTIYMNTYYPYAYFQQCQGFYDIFKHFHGKFEFCIFSRYATYWLFWNVSSKQQANKKNCCTKKSPSSFIDQRLPFCHLWYMHICTSNWHMHDEQKQTICIIEQSIESINLHAAIIIFRVFLEVEIDCN